MPIEKHNKTLLEKKYNKTVSMKENVSLDSCKPFFASSVIISGLFVYFMLIHGQKEN